jgi:hypothetical protein
MEPPKPNPAYDRAEIVLLLGQEQRVDLTVHDVAGRLVRRLVAGSLEGGRHTFYWNLRDERDAQAPAGVFVVRVTAGSTTLSRRVAILD